MNKIAIISKSTNDEQTPLVTMRFVSFDEDITEIKELIENIGEKLIKIQDDKDLFWKGRIWFLDEIIRPRVFFNDDESVNMICSKETLKKLITSWLANNENMWNIEKDLIEILQKYI